MRKILLSISSLLLALNTSAQLSSKDLKDKTVDEYEFEYEVIDDGSLDFPIAKQSINYVDIQEVITLQGINIGYTYTSTTSMSDNDFWDASKRQSFDVDVYFTNTTSEDIVFEENANFAFASLRFPSKDGFFNDGEGICRYFVSELNKVNGKPTLKAGETVYNPYHFSQVSENFIESSSQSHFHATEAQTQLPVEFVNKVKPKNDLIGYQENMRLTDIRTSTELVSNNNVSKAFIELPNKYIFFTSNFPIVKSKHNFEKNGDYIYVFKNDYFSIEVKPLDNNGKYSYRVSNLTDRDLKRSHKPIAWLHFAQGQTAEIWAKGKPKPGPAGNWDHQNMKPNEVYVGEFKVIAYPYSGEFFKDGAKLVPRKRYKKYFVFSGIDVAHFEGTIKKVGFESDKAAFNIFYPKKKSGKVGKNGAIYIGMDRRMVVLRGSVIRFETAKEQEIRFATNMFPDYVYPVKKVTKMMADDPGGFKNYRATIQMKKGQQYFFVMDSEYGRPKSVTEEQWKNLINDSTYNLDAGADDAVIVVNLDE